MNDLYDERATYCSRVGDIKGKTCMSASVISLILSMANGGSFIVIETEFVVNIPHLDSESKVA